jgi:RND superfamily putative drug exporter
MLARMARLAVAAPRRIVAITVLFMIAAAVFGIPVATRLSAGGFLDPASESARAATLAEKFNQGGTELVLFVDSADAARAAFMRVLGGLNRWAPGPLAKWHHRNFSGAGPIRPESAALRRSAR